MRWHNLRFVAPLLLFTSIAAAYASGESEKTSASVRSPERYQTSNTSDGVSSIRFERLPSVDTASHSSLHFQAGVQTLENLKLSNSYYSFEYPRGLRSASFQLGWETLPLRLAGRWGLRLDGGYSSLSTEVGLGSADSKEVSFHMFPLLGGFVYQADYTPVMRWFLPVLKAQIGVAPYVQSGNVDGLQANGSATLRLLSAEIRNRLDWMGLRSTSLSVGYSDLRAVDRDSAEFTSSSLVFGVVSQI